MTLPAVGKLPPWAVYAGGAVALYLIWKTISNPEKVGAAAGSAAVGVVTGAAKGVGAAVKGAVDGVVQKVTGDDSATLGTAIYDFFHKDENAKLTAPATYIPDKKTSVGEMDAFIAKNQIGSPRDGFETFADLAGGGFNK